jgi:hypothetical protein
MLDGCCSGVFGDVGERDCGGARHRFSIAASTTAAIFTSFLGLYVVTSEIGLYIMSQQQAPINSALTATWSPDRRQEKIVWRSIHLLVVPSHNTWPHLYTNTNPNHFIKDVLFYFGSE